MKAYDLRRFVLVGILVWAACTAALVFAESRQTRRPIVFVEQEAQFTKDFCSPSAATAVPTGTEAEARKYYRSLGRQIGLSLRDPFPAQPGDASTLDELLPYLGYGPKPPALALTAKEVQDAKPDDLMDVVALGNRLGGVRLAPTDVLVARFFAPKISDVSQLPVKGAGWRKLVRLRAQRGSIAALRGIEAGIILFNFFAPIEQADPFTGNDSANTQVILVSSNTRKSLFWVDFGKTSEGARLSHQLNAFFDAGHIPSRSGPSGGAVPYFVPCACISCHGGLRLDYSISPPAPDNRFTAPLLDYLDTDHWNDRIQKVDDFEGLRAPVLFDPGTFGVIMLINDEIRRQNVAAQPDSVLRRAVEHWLMSHLKQGPGPQPLFERSLQGSLTARQWNSGDPQDAELLPTLNRLCFRCHGTVLFDVLDREMVFKLRSNMNSVLFPQTQISDKRAAMPPDRNLSDEDFRKLRDLILRMK